MSDASKHIADHYTITDLMQQILSALKTLGKDVDQLTADDLAPVDAFHIRGRDATAELMFHASLQPKHQVLDLGSGLGGTCRFLASTVGCHVTGIDLTDEYCHAAESLSLRVGLADRNTFHSGSALDLPFDDESFDVVWTEHVQMNIADKERFYREAHRVLKPGGQFVFHDILAGDGGDLKFPVPWAADASISHLIPVDELWMMLSEMGNDIVVWEDMSEPSRAFLAQVLEKVNADGWMPLGIHLLLGDDAAEKLTNVRDNLANDRIRVVQAVTRKLG